MSIMLTPGMGLPSAEFFVFDIEAVGDCHTPTQCAIWDICITHYDTKRTLQRYIDPGWAKYPPTSHPDLLDVSASMLQEKGAVPFSAFIPEMQAFINQFPAGITVLISHGNYLLDKPLLEYELSRARVLIPSTWRFFDTLPWFRTAYKHCSSYSLNNLYKAVYKTSIVRRHSAQADATALVQLLQHSVSCRPLNGTLVGALYMPYVTPLQSVLYIGSTIERKLIAVGIECVEDLMHVFLGHCHLQPNVFSLYLVQNVQIAVPAARKLAQSMVALRLKS